MGAVIATFRRTVGRARGLYSTAFAAGGFLAFAGFLFARALETLDGTTLALPVIWAGSVSPALPVLVAMLGMDAWSDERQSGRIDMLLTIAVRERDYVLGKFLGVLAMAGAVTAVFLAASLVLLHVLAPAALVGVGLLEFAPALLALALQLALWSAVVVMTSAMSRHAATAALAAVLLTVILPRGLWLGLQLWFAADRTVFGEMPLDAHVVDIASGLLPVGTVLAYALLTLLALLVAVKSVALLRMVGRGARGLRFSTAVAVFLALVLAALAVELVQRVNPVVDVSAGGRSEELSARTRNVLADSSGSLTLTAFLPRHHPEARSVGRVLRALKRQSQSLGGVRIDLRFVDPKWDIGAAERLVRRGAVENSVVFEQGRRLVSLPVKDGFGERLCAATIRRIAAPPQRKNVYWTVGHGEIRPDDYTAFGMSDIARDLFREGFQNEPIDLSADRQIPGDCALLLVAGAKDEFSRAELGRVGAYLKDGGRLMVLLGAGEAGGVSSVLPTWGLTPGGRTVSAGKTLSGTDVVVTEFSDHPIASPLRGSRIVLDRPVVLSPSSVAGNGTGVDRIDFQPVAKAGDAAVVAAVERGGGAGDDLAVRPTRIVVLGDASFAVNGQLAARACANRDFFLNCVAYLSGTEAHGVGEDDRSRFNSGMDRLARRRHIAWSAVGLPSVLLALQLLVALRRRSRT